ncbi:MAG: hypothetical protein AAFQ94_17805 [Bacteroidota bacterium]
MAFEINPKVLSENRIQSFQNNQTSIAEKVFYFPELLRAHMLSNSIPVPTEVFDLSKSLTISDSQKEAIISGFQQIDTLTGIENALQWLLSEAVVMAKAMNKEFYEIIAAIAKKVNEIIASKLPAHLEENSASWAAGLRTIRRFQFQFNLTEIPLPFLHDLVKEKKQEDNFWLLMIELSFHFEESVFIREVIGRDWLNNYYLGLRSTFENLSELIFGDKEKLLSTDISTEDFNLDRFKESKDQIQDELKSLSNIFREFEFIKRHAVYNGIIGKFLPAYESLKGLEN